MEELSKIPKLFPQDLHLLGFYRCETPMWVFDTRTFAFLAVNDAAVRQYGYSREQFLSMTILDIRPVADVVPLLRQVLRDGRCNSDRELWKHRKKNGSLLEVEISSREVVFEGRHAELVTAMDVTAETVSGRVTTSDECSSLACPVEAKRPRG